MWIPWMASLELLGGSCQTLGCHGTACGCNDVLGFVESWNFYITGFAMLAFHACVLRLFIGLPGGCVEQKQN